MSQELKTFTIDLKSLDQTIDSPILAGAGDVNGYVLRVVFTQKAGCQLTPGSKVYLNWMHQEQKIKGYNVLTKVADCPATFEIHWPKAMLREGTVLCRLEVVDDISISPSTNFSVHVLQNPTDGSDFVVTDDFSDFQQAVIDLTTIRDEMLSELEYQKKLFDNLAPDVEGVKADAAEALEKATKAEADSTEALEKVNEIIDAGLGKSYVQSVETLPGTSEAEQNVIYVNSADGKGYMFNGDSFTAIFDNVEVEPIVNALKESLEKQLETKISYDEAKELVASVGHITRQIVDELPPVDEASETVIYMVAKQNPDSADHQVYDEYVLVNGNFEKIGDNSVDISNLATKDELQEGVESAKNLARVKADDALQESKRYTEGYFQSKVNELKETVKDVKQEIVNEYLGDTGKDDDDNVVKMTDYVTEQIKHYMTINSWD